ALIGLEGRGQRLCRLFALFAGAVLQQVQRRLDRQFCASDLKTQAGDGLIKQSVPGGISALRLLVKQLLDAILELIGPVFAQVLDPWTIMAEFRTLHRLFDYSVIDAVELERKEQQMHR